MKIQILDKTGKKIKDKETDIFSHRVREDVFMKVLEAFKMTQAYSPNFDAGNKHSASGKLKHRRHKWKGTYGRGISRVPRKIMWRRGTQFYWIGATVSGTRGGRRAHPPKLVKRLRNINKKELRLAFLSALGSTSNKDFIIKKYERINKINLNLPLVFDESLLKLKTKELFLLLKKILGEVYVVAEKTRKVRAGRGKLRGRKYKKSGGLLLVIGNNENYKSNKIDVVKTSELAIKDIDLGRLCIFTEKAVEDLEKFIEGKEKEKEEKKVERVDRRKVRKEKRRNKKTKSKKEEIKEKKLE